MSNRDIGAAGRVENGIKGGQSGDKNGEGKPNTGEGGKLLSFGEGRGAIQVGRRLKSLGSVGFLVAAILVGWVGTDKPGTFPGGLEGIGEASGLSPTLLGLSAPPEKDPQPLAERLGEKGLADATPRAPNNGDGQREEGGEIANSLDFPLDEASRSELRAIGDPEHPTHEEVDSLWRRYMAIPARPPVKDMEITSFEGWRVHPVHKDRDYHHGIDIGGEEGVGVYAPGNGRVMAVGRGMGYGNYVMLRHEPGGYETLFAHLSSTALQEGDYVVAGDLLGRMGSTGLATGPHLHFEVKRHGKHISPADLYDHMLFQRETISWVASGRPSLPSRADAPLASR